MLNGNHDRSFPLHVSSFNLLLVLIDQLLHLFDRASNDSLTDLCILTRIYHIRVSLDKPFKVVPQLPSHIVHPFHLNPHFLGIASD